MYVCMYISLTEILRISASYAFFPHFIETRVPGYGEPSLTAVRGMTPKPSSLHQRTNNRFAISKLQNLFQFLLQVLFLSFKFSNLSFAANKHHVQTCCPSTRQLSRGLLSE